MLKEDQLQRLIQRLRESGISQEDLLKINTLREQTTQALDYVDIDQDNRQWADDLLTLVDAVTSLSNLMDTQKIAVLAAGYVAYFLGADEYSFWEYQPERKQFALLNYSGIFGDNENPTDSCTTKSTAVQPFLESTIQENQMQKALINDPDLLDDWRVVLDCVGVSAMLALPVGIDSGPIGAILVCDLHKTYAFEEYQLFIAQLLTNYAGILISRTRMFEAAQRRVVELETLRQASLTLTASLDLQKVLDTILEHTLEIIPRAQDAHIFLYEDDALIFMSALWADGRKGQAWSNPRPDGLTYTVAQQGEIICVDDIVDHPLFENVTKGWAGSIVGLPLKIGERIVGVMTVAHPDKNIYSENKIRILRLLGDQAAVAIENARLHDIVNQQARTDILTLLPNRRALDERLDVEIRRSHRYQRNFSIIMLDLDGFKSVNDLHGHPQGDYVLRRIARYMQCAVRDTDYLTRYGGDEFALLLPETDAETTRQLAQRLQNDVLTFCVQLNQDASVSVGISYGCATYPEHGSDVETLLRVADKELYRQKDK